MGKNVSASSAEIEETVSLPNEAAPVAAVDGDTSTSAAGAAPASQEESSAETGPVPTTTAGPSTVVEHDPAPIQPPIQPVSNLMEEHEVLYCVNITSA